jgi:hypothetical protein
MSRQQMETKKMQDKERQRQIYNQVQYTKASHNHGPAADFCRSLQAIVGNPQAHFVVSDRNDGFMDSLQLIPSLPPMKHMS